MEDEKAEVKVTDVYPPIEDDEPKAVTEEQVEDEETVDSEDIPEETEETSTDTLEEPVEPESDDDEFIVTFEGEAPDPIEQEAEEAPSWVKELRKKHRESERENKRLEKELSSLKSQLEPKLEPLPEKPKFEDFAYDEDKYDAALQGWHEQKLKHESQQLNERKQAEAAQQQFEERRQAYHVRKSEIAKKAPDMDEAEELVTTMFDETKQGILLTAADDPAQLIYALAKNPKKLQDLASIDDPIRFTAEAAKLEARMKVTKRTPTTAPERKVKGSAPASAGSNQLERLREEAEKTGDYSKVIAYRKQRSQSAA